ncbi:hypothetical protein [Bradyrhizobium sp. HKCCYLS20291]|uniref:hypothetical protein n=1 Tax=Bradyrhizobium sp. HKCCYLS20291 TaxID=3420766 RepID=UPI003EB74F9B
MTASDGSVYGVAEGGWRVAGGSSSENRKIVERDGAHSVAAGGAEFTTISPPVGSAARNPFPIYGLWTPEKSWMGSYDCPASRPGCDAPGNRVKVGYWFSTKLNIGRSRSHFVFTATPGANPVLQRWPVVAMAGVESKGQIIVGVALDATRCFVLLQPNPGLAENRVGGRLRLDLYLASCAFSQGRLEFDQPRRIARRQASFTQKEIQLHGEFVALVESIDFGEQPEDQPPFEKDAMANAKICVRLFRMSSNGSATPENSICANSDAIKSNRLTLSPNAKYLLIESNTSPFLIPTSYRQDGRGPAWLTNGTDQ